MARVVEGPAAGALKKFEDDFAKSFGASSLVTPARSKYEVVSTGSLTLDQALGCGGVIVGRLVEIWGPGGVGKSTLSTIIAANHQIQYPKRLVGWINVERTFDEDWATDHGMIMRRTRLYNPETSQDVGDAAQKMVRSGLFSIVVIDSIGGMIGKAEMEKDAEDAVVAETARVVTRMVKQQAVWADDNKTTVLLINQVRSQIGSYGGGNTTGGGNALKHVTTHKIRMRRTATSPYMLTSKPEDGEAGIEIAAIVERNKVAPPMKIATFALFNQDSDKWGPMGIDMATEAQIMGLRYGVIENPAQGTYQLPDREKPVRGKPAVLQALRESPELLQMIRERILAMSAGDVVGELSDIEEDVEKDEDESAGPEVSEDKIEELFQTGLPQDLDHDPAVLASPVLPVLVDQP
jgi:recombination protein RecA